MLMQKLCNVYTVFDILSNNILRAQSLKCWETSSIKWVTTPLGKYTYRTNSEIAWVKWALFAIYAATQQTDFPRVHAKSIEKMELQTRSPWLLFFCSVEYWSVPPTLEIILFLDFSLQDARYIIPSISYETHWPGVEMDVLRNLAGISDNSVIVNIAIHVIWDSEFGHLNFWIT